MMLNDLIVWKVCIEIKTVEVLFPALPYTLRFLTVSDQLSTVVLFSRYISKNNPRFTPENFEVYKKITFQIILIITNHFLSAE
jgi:hypothetical protein